MYNSKFNFLFVHIPKTGGSSILDTLRKFPGERGRKWRHEFDHMVCGQCIDIWGEDVIMDAFKFTIVRNPWDKVVSDCFYNVKKGLLVGEPLVFEKYVRSIVDNNDRWKMPMIDWLTWEDSVVVDFIGKLENFQEDFNTICDKIGIPRQELRHKNKSKHKHYTEYYDDETREIVAEKYAKDIKYFGYEFGE